MKRYGGVVGLDGWVDGFCRWCWAWAVEVVSPLATRGERGGGFWRLWWKWLAEVALLLARRGIFLAVGEEF